MMTRITQMVFAYGLPKTGNKQEIGILH